MFLYFQFYNGDNDIGVEYTYFSLWLKVEAAIFSWYF